MLVLSRKADESVRIGNDIEVVIISVEGGRVKLGFKAPREVRIVRSELRRYTGSDKKVRAEDTGQFTLV